jgi:serine/threonine protein kinase
MTHFARCTDLKKFRKVDLLGQGTYGKVYKVIEAATNQVYALKKILTTLDGEGFPAVALREVCLLRSLAHPNIVRLWDIVVTEHHLYLVFEFVVSDLHGLIVKPDFSMTPAIVKRLIRQILQGLDYCHSHRIMHRDLKPGNILVDSNLNVKLADFGLARAFQIPSRPYTGRVQTLWYRAPELLMGSDQYTYAVDMWSVGCIMAELSARQVLFAGQSEINTLFMIFRVLGTPSESTWPGFTELPNFNSAFPFFPAVPLNSVIPGLDNRGIDLLSKMLKYDPSSRITAGEALHSPYFADV